MAVLYAKAAHCKAAKEDKAQEEPIFSYHLIKIEKARELNGLFLYESAN